MASDIVFEGGYSWVSGPNGWNAVQVDGVAGSIGIASAGTPINLGAQSAWTWCYWMRLDIQEDGVYYFSKDDGGHTGSDFAHINGFITSGTSEFYSAASGINGIYAIPDAAWHFYLWTYDGTALALYVDDVYAGTINPATIGNNTGNLYVGGENVSNVNSAITISQMRTYSSVLGAGDRTTLAGAGEVTTNQIGRWLFSEGSGTTVAQNAGDNPAASNHAGQMIRRHRLARAG